jgi:DNA phosphorothioation-dependent restriction protein DptH
MNYFANTVRDHIKSLIEKQDRYTNGKLLFMVSSMPEDSIVAIAKAINNYALENIQVHLTLKIANSESYSWSPENQRLITENHWSDKRGNLTYYRNLSPNITGKTVIILFGADEVTDSAGLADFYTITPELIWKKVMKESFQIWLNDKLNQSGFDSNGLELKFLDKIVKPLYTTGQADLAQISHWLHNLPYDDCVSIKEVSKMMLSNMHSFGLPRFTSLPLHKENSRLGLYINKAVEFYNYTLFLEESKRIAGLRAIDSILMAIRNGESVSIPIEDDSVRGSYSTGTDFLEGLKLYVETDESYERDKLKECDFCVIWDKILKFKTRTSKPRRAVRKLYGSPLEVFLSAIWMSLRDVAIDSQSGNSLQISEIAIVGISYMHDDTNGDDNEENQERAKNFLKSLIGGIDSLFSNYADIRIDGNTDVLVSSHIFGVYDGSSISYTSSKTAHPKLEFRVYVKTSEEVYSQNYNWPISEHHGYRLSIDLINSALAAFVKSTDDFILPSYHLQYYEELHQVISEEEVRRVMQHAIRDVRDSNEFVTNLLGDDWASVEDVLTEPLRRLSYAYKDFLQHASTVGLISSLFDDTSYWETMRKIYEESFDKVGMLENFNETSLAPMLLRAFLIIKKRPLSLHSSWHTSLFEPTAIATVLHPSVLEMLRAQIVYQFRCFNFAVNHELSKTPSINSFRSHIWQTYVDLSAIQYPLNGILYNEEKNLTSYVNGHDVIHRIGKKNDEESAPLSTRLLVNYGEESLDEDSITDSSMFRDSNESKLLVRLLQDYFDIHPHAQDGLSVAIYRNRDIQPIIAAIHTYLKILSDPGNSSKPNSRYVLTPERNRPYAISITLFTESSDDTDVQTWIEQWKERWEAADTESKFSLYRKCRFSISHRIVQTDGPNLQFFKKLINEQFEADISILYDFLHTSKGSEKADFERVNLYDVTKHRLQFPILERASCINLNPGEKYKRKRILSNRQFSLATRHSKLLHSIKTGVNQSGTLVVGSVNFAPWLDVIDAIHSKSEWVICIDPSIDDNLIRYTKSGNENNREIIGFGSGVGNHGECNYTISSQQHTLTQLNSRLKFSIRSLYTSVSGWKEDDYDRITREVIALATDLSGLSLVRATGNNDNYIHDFLAHVFSKKILGREEGFVWESLISLDAYRHWFDLSDNLSRPDLMWLRAGLNSDNKFSVRITLIECKLAEENEDHIRKAISQIDNGLKVLTSAFLPYDATNSTSDERPDRRFWWMQLHRLIASKAKVDNGVDYQAVTVALELLAEGDFDIEWSASVFAFWKNNSPDIKRINAWETNGIEANVYAIGGLFVRNMFIDQTESNVIDWNQINSNGSFHPILIPSLSSSSDSDDDIPVSDEDGDRIIEEFAEDDFDNDQEENTIEIIKPQTSIKREVKTIVRGTENENFINNYGEDEIRERDLGKRVSVKPDNANTELKQKNDQSGRILLGTTIPGKQPIYWEFMHKDLSNRHLLVFGSSGQGKTYAVQAILNEMSKFNQNSLIIDYTSGFLPNNLESKTGDILNPKQHVVRLEPLPINPFIPQSFDDGGIQLTETPNNVGSRIASIFDSVYNLGNQQNSVLHQAVMDGVQTYGNRMNMDVLMDIIDNYINEGTNKSYAQTLRNKLTPFILEKPFASGEKGFDWGHLFSDLTPMCNIFQLVQLDSNASRVVTEFILWDLYGYLQSKGDKSDPKVIVLDEVQNLDHRDGKPLSKYLREGRKFGISLILATQTMSNLKKDERDRMFNAEHKLFFRPADTELTEFAKIAAQSTQENYKDWIDKLQSLSKGECFSIGKVLKSDGVSLITRATKIKITAMEDRDFDKH